jgi:hypothetical protein
VEDLWSLTAFCHNNKQTCILVHKL